MLLTAAPVKENAGRFFFCVCFNLIPASQHVDVIVKLEFPIPIFLFENIFPENQWSFWLFQWDVCPNDALYSAILKHYRGSEPWNTVWWRSATCPTFTSEKPTVVYPCNVHFIGNLSEPSHYLLCSAVWRSRGQWSGGQRLSITGIG